MKNRKKILKVRPFNMANFSGGAGYLIFSIMYQLALLPAAFIIWFLTLIKLPKDADGNIIINKASKRFNMITIPFTVIFIIAMTAAAIYSCYGYGSLLVFGIEIAFIGITPTLCSFFVLRHFHKEVVNGKMSISKAIFISLGLIISVLIGVLFISILMDSVLVKFDLRLGLLAIEELLA